MSHTIIENIENSLLHSKILENEKICSTSFLQSLQIFDQRFDTKEYEFIETLSLYINYNEILMVIKNIIKDVNLEKNEKNIEFLILIDFLFSMTSVDFRDPANIFFKTTRNEYLQKISLRAAINIYFNCDYLTYITIHKKLLIGLRLKNILIKTEIRTKVENTWSTVIYFSLNNIPETKYDNNLGKSELPFILVDIENSKYSLGSFRNIWKVKRKKREMDDAIVCYKSAIKANQLCFVLSQKLFDLNSEKIKNKFNELLKETKCIDINDYFNKINRIINDRSYSFKLINELEKIDNESYINLYNLNKCIEKEYVQIMKNFQKIISIHVLHKIKLESFFYLPTFVDNRGRQYYGTILSPTFNKLFRFLYDFKEKKQFRNLENSKFYEKIMMYKNRVIKFNLSDTNSYIVIILFIEVGKHFVENESYLIKTEDIIDKGIEKYYEKNNQLDFYDSMYIDKLYNCIDKLLYEKTIDNNTIIFKDATASGLQNYGILLGYKLEKLKYLNLNSDDYYDTYKYLIEMFWKSDKYKKRKYLKSTIMTIPYNSVWYSCFTTFLKSLRKDGIEYKNISEKEKMK